MRCIVSQESAGVWAPQALLGVVVDALANRRFPLEDEKGLQNAMLAVLAHRFPGAVKREVRIAAGDLIDFLVHVPGRAGGIGIEVKIKGERGAIARQVARYAASPLVDAVVLATLRPMVLPATVAGKPAVVVDLGRAWL